MSVAEEPAVSPYWAENCPAEWTAAAVVAAANDDRAGLEALTGLWAALVRARSQATLFRLTVSFDRFRPAEAVQRELP